MFKASVICIAALFLSNPAFAEDSEESGDKVLSGMSVVGNDDAPKSLVIVPWKSSELGTRLDVSQIVDDGRQPVDREVFMRELNYYRISTE
ncbi:MAG: hypothetical protein PVI25_10350 [Gammaproteobacteria bacterium]|mgnify:CR=1 FL=1|jgi:hypothetical protein|nr:MAG: hypothetical protein AMJ59_16720 [Gammaproteobacteria bacterium SG8_31]